MQKASDVPATVTIAILDEPPFCWMDGDGRADGCDVAVLDVALRRIGARTLRWVEADFEELLPGVVGDRWQVTTPLFVTEERARVVRFTRPMWAVPDGLIVRRADGASSYRTYGDLAADPQARLAVVRDQVQADTARRAGVRETQLMVVRTQEDAVRAVIDGRADAAASTAVGNRAYLRRLEDERLECVDVPPAAAPAVGAPALSPARSALADALDAALSELLGTPEHRTLVARYGLGAAELDPVTAG